MVCPRCGTADVEAPECPRCGIVFAKIKDPAARADHPRAAVPEEISEQDGPTPTRAFALFAFAIVAACLAWFLERPSTTPKPLPSPTPASLPTAASRAAKQDPLGQASPLPAPGILPRSTLVPFSLPRPARQTADALQSRLLRRAPISTADVSAAEELCRQYPGETWLEDLLLMSIVAVARQEEASRHFDTALGDLRKATALRPKDSGIRLTLVDLLLETSDFKGAEAEAREVLAADPANADAFERLGFALFRQDRNREAADALKSGLDIRPTASAQQLLARVQKGLRDESGMTEQRVAHFDVRYDGEAHEDVGREIVRALERHYATLRQAFDHEPRTTVPVILFTRSAYYTASGAPAWSGGAFDGADGRIRVPVMGVTSALTPDMDSTLIHELTHAFIHDMGGQGVPQDLHEGVAQYMEGKRLSSMLRPSQLTALANGQIGGVAGYYLLALSFAEYLYGMRGQGGINDLLHAIGETGDVNQAFTRVYGQDYMATKKAWLEHFRQENAG